MSQPKGIKGTQRKLLRETLIANRGMKEAITVASEALDQSGRELMILRRLLISERAQVIYYSDKYLACLKGECLDLKPANFLDLDESVQEPYVKRAVMELSDSRGVVPHDKSATVPKSVAKKIVLPN
jgi:hypothetical protein